MTTIQTTSSSIEVQALTMVDRRTPSHGRALSEAQTVPTAEVEWAHTVTAAEGQTLTMARVWMRLNRKRDRGSRRRR